MGATSEVRSPRSDSLDFISSSAWRLGSPALSPRDSATSRALRQPVQPFQAPRAREPLLPAVPPYPEPTPTPPIRTTPTTPTTRSTAFRINSGHSLFPAK